MNVARYRVDGETYLKWRSWQFRAKDVTGIPGLAGQPWPEITVHVRSHTGTARYQIFRNLRCPLTQEMFGLFILRKWWSTYQPALQFCWAYLCIQLKHRDWRRELLQQGKGEKEGRFLTTWNREIDQSWPGWGWRSSRATNLTDTEGRTYRQDHENTQSKYSTLKGIVGLITNNKWHLQRIVVINTSWNPICNGWLRSN